MPENEAPVRGAAGVAVSVVLPTYNERENIGPLVRGVFEHAGRPAEVIVVDDDSPDGTWRVVEEMARERPGLRLLRRTTEKGLVSALRDGIRAAAAPVIVWMDCDLSMPPDRIPALLEAIDGGCDIAVGSRYVPGGGVELVTGSRDTLRAFVLSSLLNRWIQAMLGAAFKDYTSGFIAVRKTVLDRFPLRGDYGEYFIELIHRAARSGFRIAEIPYLNRSRTAGDSKTGTRFADYLRKGWKYVRLTVRLRLTRRG